MGRVDACFTDRGCNKARPSFAENPDATDISLYEKPQAQQFDFESEAGIDRYIANLRTSIQQRVFRGQGILTTRCPWFPLLLGTTARLSQAICVCGGYKLEQAVTCGGSATIKELPPLALPCVQAFSADSRQAHEPNGRLRPALYTRILFADGSRGRAARGRALLRLLRRSGRAARPSRLLRGRYHPLCRGYLRAGGTASWQHEIWNVLLRDKIQYERGNLLDDLRELYRRLPRPRRKRFIDILRGAHAYDIRAPLSESGNLRA